MVSQPHRAPRVHDLLRLEDEARDRLIKDAEEDGAVWAADSLTSNPWVVVRRARPSEPSLLAIGIRGDRRIHRRAAEIPADGFSCLLAPPDLVDRVDLVGPERSRLGAVSACRILASMKSPGPPHLHTGQCGPGGSLGVELATGSSTVTRDSDLDLVIQVQDIPCPSDLGDIANLLADIAEQTGTRVDTLLETPSGGFALGELIESMRTGASPTVAMRTACGPKLVAIPGRLP